jgi:hypothetical protein
MARTHDDLLGDNGARFEPPAQPAKGAQARRFESIMNVDWNDPQGQNEQQSKCDSHQQRSEEESHKCLMTI